MTNLNRFNLTLGLALLAVLQLVGVLYFINYFVTNDYLPSPFVYDKSDSFMDFFHVLYWSSDSGRYSVWGSIYPPLNFLLMKFFGILFVGTNTFADGFEMRSHSLAFRFFVVLLAISMVALAMRSRLWDSYSTVQKCLFFVFFALSSPVLFAIERGNIIFLCLPFLAGVMATSGVRRLLFIAILINLKPYFALLALAPIVAGKWQDLLFIGMSAGAIFIFTGLMLDPNFLYFLPNILSFGQSETIFSGREVLALPSSIDAFAYALKATTNKAASLGDYGFDLSQIAHLISVLNKFTLVLAFFALIYAGNNFSQNQLIAFLIVFICNMGVWVGGYTFMFYPLIIPAILLFRNWKILVTLILLILLPLDVIVLWRDALSGQSVFFSGLIQTVEFQIGLGTLLRPPLNFVLLFLLSLEILAGRWSRSLTDYNKGTLSL